VTSMFMRIQEYMCIFVCRLIYVCAYMYACVCIHVCDMTDAYGEMFINITFLGEDLRDIHIHVHTRICVYWCVYMSHT